MTTIIAFAGRIGSGKDTAAEYFVKEHNFDHYKFAEPIQDIVAMLTGDYQSSMQHRQLFKDRFWKESVFYGVANKSPRELMKYIGEDFRKNIDDNIWVNKLQLDIENNNSSRVVISDLRYPNELNWLRSYDNSKLIYIIDPNQEQVEDNAEVHSSESYHDYLQSKADLIVYNYKQEGLNRFYLSLSTIQY